MTIAAAAGMRRALVGRAGGTWGPRLIAVYGAALMAAGALRADPADGFGPGAPAGKAAHVSWHAAGHLISASIGFTALIVACFVVGPLLRGRAASLDRGDLGLPVPASLIHHDENRESRIGRRTCVT